MLPKLSIRPGSKEDAAQKQRENKRAKEQHAHPLTRLRLADLQPHKLVEEEAIRGDAHAYTKSRQCYPFEGSQFLHFLLPDFNVFTAVLLVQLPVLWQINGCELTPPLGQGQTTRPSSS